MTLRTIQTNLLCMNQSNQTLAAEIQNRLNGTGVSPAQLMALSKASGLNFLQALKFVEGSFLLSRLSSATGGSELLLNRLAFLVRANHAGLPGLLVSRGEADGIEARLQTHSKSDTEDRVDRFVRGEISERAVSIGLTGEERIYAQERLRQIKAQPTNAFFQRSGGNVVQFTEQEIVDVSNFLRLHGVDKLADSTLPWLVKSLETTKVGLQGGFNRERVKEMLSLLREAQAKRPSIAETDAQLLQLANALVKSNESGLPVFNFVKVPMHLQEKLLERFTELASRLSLDKHPFLDLAISRLRAEFEVTPKQA
jgi:hypothetical protein